ncbi:MAG: hypothetical protein HOO06_14360 [Bdellovibrionaceae bacterium]|jgi:hypothetical protein|nr:hypothetical protein [Pseudobdellovibrionaceae bacterium]
MKQLLVIFSFLLMFAPSLLQAETMFEGYYKILSGNVPIGYVIQRYSYLPKKKQFESIYYIHTNALGGGTKESVKAYADDKFNPISYAYTAKIGKITQVIDAKFKQVKGVNVMSAIIKKGKTVERIQNRKLPKNTFLSTFLGYKLLQKTYKVGPKFKYSAIAEEDGQVYTGLSWIKEKKKFLNKDSFRILNTFKGTKFISYVTKEGEVLGTKSPLQQIETQLVKSPHLATKNFTLNTKVLRQLFGQMPTGAKNSLANPVKK